MSSTPEKAMVQVVSMAQKTTPSKAATPVKLAGEKSKTPEKKVIAGHSKKRQHDESDDEEEIKEGNLLRGYIL